MCSLSVDLLASASEFESYGSWFFDLLIAAYYSEHMNNNILDNSTNDIFR